MSVGLICQCVLSIMTVCQSRYLGSAWLEMISLMESSELLGSNWSFRCKAYRNGWATSAGSCRLACCPQSVLTATQSGVRSGCVLNWCGVCTGTHRLCSSSTCVGVRAPVAGTRDLTTNRPPLTKSHPFE